MPLETQIVTVDPALLLKQQIVDACHILVRLHLDSGPFGNISIRLPKTDVFYVNPSDVMFRHMTAQDIVGLAIDGSLVEGGRKPHPGTFIHREIYRLRPDVNAIVHTHSKNTVLISLLGCSIEPFTQLGAALYGDQGVYQGFTGPVRTSDEGHAIASALGGHAIVIAKNHGLFAVGNSIQAALWDMIVADWASDIHLEAKKLGLDRAERLPSEYIQKSKIEVRHRQCQAMWDSYLQG